MNEVVKLSADARRSLIIETAVTIANKHGLAAVTNAAVSRECSIMTSIPTIRRYFWTKDDLLRAIVGHRNALPHVREVGRELGF